MFVFRKIWCALFSCYLRLENCHFALLSTRFCIIKMCKLSHWTKIGIVLFHVTRSNDSRSNNPRFMYKLPFFACHEQPDARESSLHCIENFTGYFDLRYAISFHRFTSRFADRTILFVYRINLSNSQSKPVRVLSKYYLYCSGIF